MSDKKKTESIISSGKSEPIDLSGGQKINKQKLSKSPDLRKRTPSYSRIDDIKIKNKEDTSIYLMVKPNRYYKFISGFLKIAVVGFVILFVINIFNVYMKGLEAKKELSSLAYQGYSKLLEGSKETTKIKFTQARESFDKALESFKEAENSLWFMANDETIYAHESTLSSSAKAIFNSGKYFAEAGEYFTEALEELNKIPLYIISKNEQNSETVIKEDVTAVLKNGIDKANLALVEVRSASTELDKINESLLPPEIHDQFIYAKEKIKQLIETLESAEVNFPAIMKLLGDERPHRYLILLQNNSEIRPSGGFIGSYIILDMNDGLIANMKVEDVYDLDGKFAEVIEPPKFMQKYTSDWRLRDSNYSPDFFYSGAKAAWMLQKENGPSVDTVIAVNQSLLKDFLEITGPIQVGKLQNKITAENYDAVLTYIIESKLWGEEDPKHVLKIMVPEFQKALLKKENVAKIMSVLYKAAQQKQILAYSRDSVVETFFDILGISGRVKNLEENEDYLSVIHASVGGNKTEPLIEEKITHNSTIKNSGEIVNELTISRKDTFGRDAQQKLNDIWDNFGFDHKTVPGYVVDILGKAQNRVNTRIFVPEGSKLSKVEGITEDMVTIGYDEELNKTYFQLEMSVLPGNEAFVKITYSLPFRLKFSPLDTYKLTVQKQPGSKGSLLNKEISMEENSGFTPYTYYPEEAMLSSKNKVTYSTTLTTDKYFSVVFGQ